MRKIWDHAIDLKEGFIPRKEEIYSEVDKKEGFIPRKEEIYSEVDKKEVDLTIKVTTDCTGIFFVGKKDRKKRMVQDYWYLNKQMVKNNYPLLLISDIIKNIRTKKVFIKLDLRWGYNNVRIKEENKWKVAFTTPEGLFEPTVMFFGLTNSPATFQAIINKLLRDLINTGKVGSFICETREM